MASWNLEAAAGAPGTSLLWRGTWSSALSYNPNDGVLASNGCGYISLTNNSNKDPVSNPSDWSMIVSVGAGAYTTTTADFIVPDVGASVVVDVANASWVTIGQMVVVQSAGGSPTDAYTFKVTAKAGNQITLQNVASVPLSTIDNTIYSYQDHFLTGSDGTYTNLTATGTGAAKAQAPSEADHPGIYQLTTGTSNGAAATGYAFITANNAYFYGTGSLAFRTVFKTPAAKATDTAASLSKIFLGMGTQPTNGTYPGADFVGFVFDPSSGMTNAANNWGILTRKASVSTYTDTGFAFSISSWADFSFYLDSTGVSFKAYAWAGTIPAKSVAITSNVPLASTPLCLVLHVLNGPSGTTTYQSFIDAWEAAYRGNTITPVFRGSGLLTNF